MSNDNSNKQQQPTTTATLTEQTPLVPSSSSSTTATITDTDSIWQDAWDTIRLGIPIFWAMLSWVGMKTTDSALLGHISTNAQEALSASSFADLWTMTTGVLIQARVLGILIGAAIGAGNPKLAGIYLQVSYVVLAGVVVVVMLVWMFLTQPVWRWWGVDPEIASMAGYYASVLALSLPAQLAFGQASQFFSAQRILGPEVQASLAALALNLVLGLVFVLGVGVPGFGGLGFWASPIVTTVTVYLQVLFLWFVAVYWQQLHKSCWGGWAWSEITYNRMRTFLVLYVPAALGSASDFWRVAAVGAVAATLGEAEVAVFNTSYRIMWMVLILVNALSSAAGIKISLRLGRLEAERAKQAAHVGMGLSALLLLLLGGLIYAKIRTLGRIFTEHKDFLDLLEEAALPYTATLILMNLSVAIERVPYAMGRTKEVFWYGLFASWGAQVPGVILCTTYWRADLVGLYSGMCIGYFTLCVLYGWIALTSDWKKYALLARQRSEMADEKTVEVTV